MIKEEVVNRRRDMSRVRSREKESPKKVTPGVQRKTDGNEECKEGLKDLSDQAVPIRSEFLVHCFLHDLGLCMTAQRIQLLGE